MKLDSHDSKYKLFVDLATRALTALRADETPARAAQIWEWIEQNHPNELEVLRPSWGSHLSAATNDPSTRIQREPGRYTYILIDEAAADLGTSTLETTALVNLAPVAADAPGGTAESALSAPLEPPFIEADQPVYTKREAALYPVLRDWLAARQFRAEVTCNSKGGRTWGNPDVAGIKVAEGFLGRRDLELVTIEAKLSLSGWRQLIFEAISHKRFAHRAYFAFAFGADEPGLDRIREVAELRKYAERYRVGVLVVFMPTASYKRLTEDEGDVKVNTADVRVEELWPALHDDVPADELVHYLHRVLKLETDDALYGFGRE